MRPLISSTAIGGAAAAFPGLHVAVNPPLPASHLAIVRSSPTSGHGTLELVRGIRREHATGAAPGCAHLGGDHADAESGRVMGSHTVEMCGNTPARQCYCGRPTHPLAWAFVTESRALDGPVGLVGAGYIGHLFAQQFALAGYEVRAWSPARSVLTLHDRLRQSVSTLAELGAVEPSAVDSVLGLVTVHDDLAAALGPSSAVMESIVEDAEIKAACYRDVEAVVRADALLWSSTSNFPMTKLAAGMAHPERALVLHPVQTALIIFTEVVAGERTSEDSVTTTMRFCEDVSLRAVRVRKEIPGFLWNRVWFALLREMLHLVDIGAADPVELDSMVQTTLRAFIPVFGPLQMTDLIGHDTLRDISNALYPELAADQTASTTIEQHVEDGRLGVKSGQGFYDDNDQRVAELSSKLYRIARDLDEERA